MRPGSPHQSSPCGSRPATQAASRAEHRRCEALCDGDIVEAAIAELCPQSFPPVHSIVHCGAPVLGEHLIERRPVRRRSRRAVRAGEVPLSDSCLEVLQRHAPQIRPVVQELGQALPEIRILRTSLELNKRQVTSVAQEDEINAAGVQARLASHDYRGTDQAKLFQRHSGCSLSCSCSCSSCSAGTCSSTCLLPSGSSITSLRAMPITLPARWAHRQRTRGLQQARPRGENRPLARPDHLQMRQQSLAEMALQRAG